MVYWFEPLLPKYGHFKFYANCGWHVLLPCAGGINFCCSNLAKILADNWLQLTPDSDQQSTATDNKLWPIINCDQQSIATDNSLLPTCTCTLWPRRPLLLFKLSQNIGTSFTIDNWLWLTIDCDWQATATYNCLQPVQVITTARYQNLHKLHFFFISPGWDLHHQGILRGGQNFHFVHFCYSNLVKILDNNQLRPTIDCDQQSTVTNN